MFQFLTFSLLISIHSFTTSSPSSPPFPDDGMFQTARPSLSHSHSLYWERRRPLLLLSPSLVETERAAERARGSEDKSRKSSARLRVCAWERERRGRAEREESGRASEEREKGVRCPSPALAALTLLQKQSRRRDETRRERDFPCNSISHPLPSLLHSLPLHTHTLSPPVHSLTRLMHDSLCRV